MTPLRARSALLCGLLAAALLAPVSVAATDAATAPVVQVQSSGHDDSPATQPSTKLRIRAPKAGFGFADGMSILALSPRGLERALTAVERTGATWLRIPVNWSQIEQRRGRYQWSTLDRVVRAAHRHDLKILANISRAPAWSRAFLSDPSAPPANPATFADFSAKVVQRYGKRIRHWEIWNEPNLNVFFGGIRTHGSAPELYTRLLKPAYRAIHRKQPRAVVVAGALSSSPSSSSSYSMSTFVTRMYAAGARGSFDALSLHPYIGSGTDTARRRVYLDVRRVRRLMVEHNNKTKRIWWTELGHSTWTRGVSEKQQRNLIVEQLSAAARRSYVGPTFVYAIRDSGSSRASLADNFGALLTHDFRPKLLARTLGRSSN